jgi:hypothetical protein
MQIRNPWVRFVSRITWGRIVASAQDHLSAVSQVVREGGLDDEEEDYDNETGFSLAEERAIPEEDEEGPLDDSAHTEL